MIWPLVALCWIISFLFAGIEAGLLALDPVRLRHRAKSGDRAARRLQEMLKQPERLLITVLLVTNAADITRPHHSDTRTRPASGLDWLPDCRCYRAAGLSFPPRGPAEIVVPPVPLRAVVQAFRLS